MPEIIIKTTVSTPPISWLGVALNLRYNYEGRVSAVCRSLQECEDLIRWFGNGDFCPAKPVLIAIPDHPQIIDCQGYAPVDELRDLAVVIWETVTERLAEHGNIHNMDEMRWKHGYPEREKADAMIREAMYERIRKHKANPITDPFRQMIYPNPANRTLMVAPESQDWKASE